MPMGEGINPATSYTEEVEIHNVDTEEEVSDKLRGEEDCGDELREPS